MNQKVYAAAALLGDEDKKRDRGAFFKSIHGTLNHLLIGDRVWLGRFEGVVPEPGCMGPGGIRSLDQELYADFEELRRERAVTDDALHAWATAATADTLAGTLRYARRGATREHPMWWAVTHLFNHGTHHRGQVTTLLMQAGQDPGATDLIAMLNEE